MGTFNKSDRFDKYTTLSVAQTALGSADKVIDRHLNGLLFTNCLASDQFLPRSLNFKFHFNINNTRKTKIYTDDSR